MIDAIKDRIRTTAIDIRHELLVEALIAMATHKPSQITDLIDGTTDDKEQQFLLDIMSVTIVSILSRKENK